MTRKYDFVTKLMSGKTDASAKTRWWPRHARGMTRYLLLISSPDAAAQKSARDVMIMGANEWEAQICRPNPPSLMLDHSALEIALIDAAARKDVGGMERVGARLTANAKAQTEFYASRVKEFPATRWYALLMEHIKLFTETAQYHMGGQEKRFSECEERRERNTLALAEVTTEWL